MVLVVECAKLIAKFGAANTSILFDQFGCGKFLLLKNSIPKSYVALVFSSTLIVSNLVDYACGFIMKLLVLNFSKANFVLVMECIGFKAKSEATKTSPMLIFCI